jgi:hypothetical protein
VRGKDTVAQPIEQGERFIPDFIGRMKAMFGDVPADTDVTQWIREDRDSRD